MATIKKYLIQDGNNIICVKPSVFQILGQIPVTEDMFVSNGSDDLSGLNDSTVYNQLSSKFKILQYKK
jgi:hypothetical protein